MKMILFFASIITLLGANGCVVDDRGGSRGWGHDRYHGGVIVARPVVVVGAPEVIVR
jgi:hypothetical protein